MYIDRLEWIDPVQPVHVYYDWYPKFEEAELSITQYNDSKYDTSEYLGYVPLEQLHEFARKLPSTARWEQVQFLWNTFTANEL